MTPDLLRRFSSADANSDGVLQFSEFCELVARLQREQVGQAAGAWDAPLSLTGAAPLHLASATELFEADSVFDQYDTDNSGYLSTRELRGALKQMKLFSDRSETIAILHEFDRDGNGAPRPVLIAPASPLTRARIRAQPPPQPRHRALRRATGKLDRTEFARRVRLSTP